MSNDCISSSVPVGTPIPILANPFQVYQTFLHTNQIVFSTAIMHPWVSFQLLWHQDDQHFGCGFGSLINTKPFPSAAEILSSVYSTDKLQKPADWILWQEVAIPGSFGSEHKLAPDGNIVLALSANSTITIKSTKLGTIAQTYVLRKVGAKPMVATGDTSASITTLFTATEDSGAASTVSLALTAGYWYEAIVK